MNKLPVFLFMIILLFALVLGGCQIPPPLQTQESQVLSTVTATIAVPHTQIPTETHAPTVIPSLTNTAYPLPNAVLSLDNAPQMQQLARLTKGKVNALVYSPDNNYLVVGTSIGIAIYDTHTWSETMIELEHSVIALEFSPKGDFLGVGLDNGVIQLWRIPQWSPTQTLVYDSVEAFVVSKNYWQGWYQGLEFQQNVGNVEGSVVFSPDGNLVAAGGLGNVKVWRVSDGTLLETIKIDCSTNDIAFSPDGKMIAISACDISLWQTANGRKIYQFEDYSVSSNSSPEFFTSIVFSEDGTSLVGWSGEAVVSWQLSGGKIAKSFSIPGWDTASNLSLDGKTLAIAIDELLGDDPASDRLEVWDLDSAQKYQLDVNHPDLIRKLALAPDHTTLAVSFDDGRIQVLDIVENALRQTLDGFPAIVDDVKLSPNGAEFFSLTILFKHPFLRIWNLADGVVQKIVDLNIYGAEDAGKIVFSPDGALLAIASKDLRLWDFRKGTLLQTFKGDEENLYSNVNNVVFSPDGKTIAYSFDFGKVTLATTSGQVIRTLENAHSGGDSLCIFNDGQTLLSNGATHFWNLADGKLIKTTPNTYGRWFFFTPGCDLFAAMTWDGYFRVMQNTSEQFAERVGEFDLRAQEIYLASPVAFSPDRNLVAVQEAIGKIRIFSLQTKKTVTVLSGHKDRITSLNFSIDGKLLISSSMDGTIRLWGIGP